MFDAKDAERPRIAPGHLPNDLHVEILLHAGQNWPIVEIWYLFPENCTIMHEIVI
ncbi:hypothetical protein LJC33_01770 [Eubacteriales bacterium OttesenSCG-928-N13]|nr:hypothetical protein [Eubacteriales bacterium OttesenSCG-928-N13]